MTRKQRLGFVVSGVVAATIVATSVASAAFDAPILLGEASVIRLKDVATAGRAVAVGWQEDRSPGELWVRVSTDGGATFRRRYAVAGAGPAGMSLAICSQQVWAVSAARYPGDELGNTDLLLSRRGVSAGGGTQLFLTQPGADHAVKRPDIACVGDRLLAMAWLDKTTSGGRAYLLVRDQAGLLPAATNALYDLGEARLRGGISVAATSDSISVAWTRGSEQELRFKRFRVGPGASPDITPVRTVRRATGGISQPVIAARGTKVALAYTDDGQLKMRLSEDDGRTFGAPLMLVQVGRPTNPARATSVDLRSRRLVVEAQRPASRTSGAGPAAAGDQVPYRLESTDAGVTWAKTSLGNRGIRIGVLRPVVDGKSLLLEAWHDDGDSIDVLRFQREVP